MTGRDIAAERARQNVKQDALAAERGIYTATLIDIENNKVRLSQSEYRDIRNLIRDMAAQVAAVA